MTAVITNNQTERVRHAPALDLANAAPLPPAQVGGLSAIVVGVTSVLALASAIGWAVNAKQFSFSYLTAYVFAASLGVGALFWIMMHHLTSAGWSVVVRRSLENLALCLIPLALLLLPIALNLTTLYSWTDSERYGSDAIWQAKRGYLNVGFFLLRAVVYVLCWAGLAWRLRSLSVRQDRTGESGLSRLLTRDSAWGLILLALTTTYAAFDWLMSLDFHWSSTMYGVYFWAGALVGSLAAVTLVATVLHSVGMLRGVLTVEHLHDLGKLLFSFVIFWAYIAFCQYLLIWYANLREETPWYLDRMHGTWLTILIVLAIGHFVLPFFVLMSRAAKRSPLILGLAAAWVLAFHYLDLYWQVMPVLHPDGWAPHWLDAALPLAFIWGVVIVLLYGMRNAALVPVGDPRLAEALHYHND